MKNLQSSLAKIILPAILMVPVLSSCNVEDYEGKSAQKMGEQAMEDAYKLGDRGKRIAWCQAKVISSSDLPKHIADKILKANDPAVKARKFGYRDLGRKLKDCVAANR